MRKRNKMEQIIRQAKIRLYYIKHGLKLVIDNTKEKKNGFEKLGTNNDKNTKQV